MRHGQRKFRPDNKDDKEDRHACELGNLPRSPTHSWLGRKTPSPLPTILPNRRLHRFGYRFSVPHFYTLFAPQRLATLSGSTAAIRLDSARVHCPGMAFGQSSVRQMCRTRNLSAEVRQLLLVSSFGQPALVRPAETSELAESCL